MQRTERFQPEAAAFLGIVMLITALMAAVIAGLTVGNIWPAADGTAVKSGGSLMIDASHMEDGYVMVSGPSTEKKLKLRVRYGEETQTYDLNGSQEYEVIPLLFGSGDYAFTLYKNSSGNRYSEAGVIRLKAELTDEDVALICPNQYIRYDQDSQAVQKSNELCAGLKNDREKFDAISRFVEENFVYDYVQATLVAAGTRPDIERCFQRRMGICQDLAAMVVCMLRVQSIPTKMMVGYANEKYHAWVVAKIDGNEVFYDPTAMLNAVNGKIEYTAEKFY